jgi:hypothetical protein
MTLQRVSFEKPREHAPRLSAPRVPGKRDKRYWTEAEIETVRAHYPAGGAQACLLHLPHHRTIISVYALANKLKLTAAIVRGGGAKVKIIAPPDLDEQMRRDWPLMSGDKRGEVNKWADERGLPRWWVTKRATKLGLTMPHKKEPPWSAAEDELLKRAPVHNLDQAAALFRAHGFNRSPTAINIRCKRKEISRRAARPTMSATRVAKILGIDAKGVTREILQGDLPATKRTDQRLPQQGGSSWDITREDFRAYIVEHLDRVDFRKVDKFELVDILINPHPHQAPLPDAVLPEEAAGGEVSSKGLPANLTSNQQGA